MSKNPIDRAQRLLSALGWSHGEISYWQDGRQAWQVYTHRDDDRIVVNAWTHSAAWNEAIRQAGVLQRGG